MAWIIFFSSAFGIVISAHYLAKFGDTIAIRTRLGGMFIGILLLAGATSLPELLTSIASIQQNTPNIAAGSFLGSNSINMLLLAILDLVFHKQRILRKAAKRHALTGSLAVMMIVLVLYFLQARVDVSIGWVGLDSILIFGAYFFAVKLISDDTKQEAHLEMEVPEGTPGLWTGIVGFLISAGVLIYITPWMVSSSTEIAEITGLGTTFIGTTLVALVTSLPEIVTTFAAIRIGSSDMAIGNLFGSNMFNMFALGLTDLFYTQGNFLAVIDSSFMLVGLLGLLMTIVGLVGNLARLESRLFRIEIDSLLLFVLYLSGMWMLYQRGL